MLKDLVLKNRSYRGYDKTRKVTGQELQEFVDLARITASSANIQPLKYYVSSKEQEVEDILKLTKCAAALPDLSLPYPEMGPSGFIVICLDTAIGPNETTFLRDIGIASQTMLLAAAEKELERGLLRHRRRQKRAEKASAASGGNRAQSGGSLRPSRGKDRAHGRGGGWEYALLPG